MKKELLIILGQLSVCITFLLVLHLVPRYCLDQNNIGIWWQQLYEHSFVVNVYKLFNIIHIYTIYSLNFKLLRISWEYINVVREDYQNRLSARNILFFSFFFIFLLLPIFILGVTIQKIVLKKKGFIRAWRFFLYLFDFFP